MSDSLSRRELLAQAGTACIGVGIMASASTSAAAEPESRRPANEPFGYCFNTSTIRGQKLSLLEEIDVAAKAGFQAIEPWISKIDEFVKAGGSLRDVARRLSDLGLTVESGIGFAEWIVDDDGRRARGMEQAKRDMDMLRQIGGKRLAAPPAGATDRPDLDLRKAAERYRALLELGDKMDVVPQAEVWGFSQCLTRLSQATFVAIESRHPKACVLPDVYHLYKGGSDFDGLRLLSGNAVQVIHVNDYPADPPRDTIKDSDRIYPGDGIAPLSEIFKSMYQAGFRGYLSLELFNAEYWREDALEVARTGLKKTREAVQRAFV